MRNKLFAIAKVTRASGLEGEVGLRPLIRQFDDYVGRGYRLFANFDVLRLKNSIQENLSWKSLES